MAKQGTFGALTRLTPIRTDFGDIFREQEAAKSRLGEQERLQMEKQRQRNEALAEQAGIDMAALNTTITGLQSVDQANYAHTMQTQKDIGDLYRQARDNPRLLQDPEWKMRRANLNAMPDRLGAAQKGMITWTTNVNKGLMDGSASNYNQLLLDEASAFFGYTDPKTGKTTPYYTMYNDKQGNTIAVGRKPDGDLFETNINAVVDGYEFNEIIPTIDVQKDTGEYAKTLGHRETSKVEGGFIVSEQTFDLLRPEVVERANTLMGTADEPTPYAKSVWADEMGMKTKLSGEDVQKVKDYYVSQVESKYDVFTKKKQVGSYGRASFGQKRDVQESFFLYDLASRGAKGGAAALNEINSKLVVTDAAGKPIKGARIRETDDALVLVSGEEGQERILDQRSKSLPEEEIKIWIANKIRGTERSNETRQLFEQGRSQAQQKGVTPQVKRTVPAGKQERMSTLNFSSVKSDLQKLPGKKFAKNFNKNFGFGNDDLDRNDMFKAKKGYWRTITITPPPGKGESVDFKYTGDFVGQDVIDKIEAFVNEKSRETELRFVQPKKTKEVDPEDPI